MKSKPQEDEDLEMRELGLDEGEVPIDDFKDIKIDMVASSRGQRLGWNKYTVDKVTGFNDCD
jgi:hypothetical protein